MHTSESTYLILGCSALVIIAGAAVSFYFGRRTKTSGDWLVAGRSLPLYVVVFTQFATAVGGGVLVAHIGISYAWGWSVFVYEAFVLVGFLILAVIGRWLREQEFSTIPDILRKLYSDHPLVTGLAALLTIVVPFGWLATQFVAFAKLFSQITGAPVPALIVIMALVSLLFVLPGGLLSVAWSDFLFGVFMMAISFAIAAYAVHMAGGWSGITQHVPHHLWSFPDGLGAAGGSTIVLWLFAIVPGTLTNQLYYQRIFATRSVRMARRGLIISGCLTLASGVYAALVGLSVRAIHPEFSVGDREMAAGWFLSQLPPWLLGIYAAFLMATIVSTTGSALQSVVTNLVRDLYAEVKHQQRSDQHTVALSRVVTVGVTAVAAVLAIAFPSALDLLVASYAYSASTLAAPIFVGYALRRRSGALKSSTALTGMVTGLVCCAGAQIADTTTPYAVFGIAGSVVSMLIAYGITRTKTGQLDGYKATEKVQ